jgi:hypothetical protein
MTAGASTTFQACALLAAIEELRVLAGSDTGHVPASTRGLEIAAPQAGVTVLDGGEPAAGSPPTGDWLVSRLG